MRIISPAKKMNADTDTLCKMARGEMVRFMAVNGIEKAEEIRAFDELDYRYDEKYSDAQTYVFVRRKKEKLPEFE